MEKFCDLFTLRPPDLITTLTYILIDKFCPCLMFTQIILKLKGIYLPRIFCLRILISAVQFVLKLNNNNIDIAQKILEI